MARWVGIGESSSVKAAALVGQQDPLPTVKVKGLSAHSDRTTAKVWTEKLRRRGGKQVAARGTRPALHGSLWPLMLLLPDPLQRAGSSQGTNGLRELRDGGHWCHSWKGAT